MKWKAPKIDDISQSKGLIDSSSYHFNHDSTNSLIRESFQNSLDVPDLSSKDPVKIVFKLHEVSRKSRLHKTELQDMIARLKSMSFNQKPKSKKWFSNLYKRWGINKEYPTILELSDYNTQGAIGENDHQATSIV